MWRSRSKSNLLVHNSSPNLSFSSFKDAHNLRSDDNSQSPVQRNPNSSPNPNPSFFHRIRVTSSVLRAFRDKPSESVPETDASPAVFVNPVKETYASPAISVNPVKNPSPASVKESEHVPELPAISENVVKQPGTKISIPGAEKRVVVYLTSLRVVRSTFEDCRAVQSILRGFRVTVDERDLSMDSSFLAELQRILGHYYGKSKMTLPRVFIGGRYIGGADEVISLHETGELKKIVKGLPAAAPGVCEVCGGYRFILCDECNGSHKCYTESDTDGDGGFTSCTSCNENGLVRCPLCACEPLATV